MAEKAEIEEIKGEEVHIVFTGLHLGKGNKKWYGFREIKPNGELGHSAYFGKHLLAGRPGIIIKARIERGEDGEMESVYGTGREIDGYYGDEALVMEWQAKHDAATNRMATIREINKLKKRNLVQEQLEALHQIYLTTPTRQRSAFLGAVIEFITRG